MSRFSMGLIADIGGTNARFSLCSAQGELVSPLVLECKNYPSLESAAKAYLEKTKYQGEIKNAAFAIACPVLSDTVSMTNSDWSFSITQTQDALGLERLYSILSSGSPYTFFKKSTREGKTPYHFFTKGFIFFA